jgi:DNA-binding CsgD family transcriptional regulator
MERLTKKELRALLEIIKECYLICDLETFAQRVVSRLSKILPIEIISHNGVHPHAPRNVCPAAYPHGASQKKTFAPCMHDQSAVNHRARRHENPQEQLHRLELHNKVYRRFGGKNRLVPALAKDVAVNCKTKNLAVHKLLLNLLSPHLNQAYRNAQTFTYMQQKLTLVDRGLYRLNLGLIFLAPDGKIRLATTWAMQILTTYFGLHSLRKNRLPEPLWTWIKQQEVASSRKDEVALQRSQLVLARDGKRLVIRLVSDLDQNLLLLEEHPTTMQLQSLVPFGLSPRETQVLDWVAQGKTNKEIGVILELSPRTVQKHLEHIYRKIYVESRTAAAAKAHEIASMVTNQTSTFFLVIICSLMT